MASVQGMTRQWLGPMPRPAHRPRKEWWGPWVPLPTFMDMARSLSGTDTEHAKRIAEILSQPDPIFEGMEWRNG